MMAVPNGGTWSSSNTGIATVGTGTGLVTGVSAGTATISYRVTTTGCFTTRTLTVNSVAGRPTNAEPMAKADLGFNFYPNPSNGNLTVTTEKIGSLYLYAQDGRLVAEYFIDQPTMAISLPGSLSAGVYFCRFVSQEGASAAARLIYNP
jgi:hypothetical protein